MSTSTIQATAKPTDHTSIEDELSKVEIFNDICDFEEKLAELVTSVDKFNPDLKIARSLIEVDARLSKTLESFPKYDEIDERLKRLDREREQIEERTIKILQTLTECHERLNTLPMAEQVEFERKTMLKQRDKVYSNVLLDYAMKLAKFTHIPPTFDKGTVGPNNFIWPAEDALRRGMLAMASLRAKELTRLPGQAEEDKQQENKDEDDKVELKEEAQIDTKEENITPKGDSLVFDGNAGGDSEKVDENDSGMELDLDLFNPDEF